VTILIISIGQLFSLKYSLIDEIHAAFAQSNNSRNLLVPSNMNRTEITLKNDDSINSNLFLANPLIIAIISGGTAILGGIMGSYMTNRSNRQMEDIRYKRERQEEREKQEQLEKQKIQYKEKVTAVIYSELTTFSSTLGQIQDEDFWEGANEFDYGKFMKSLFESFRLEFLGIPFDTRLTLFDPNVLYLVQTAYIGIESFKKNFLLLLEQKEGLDSKIFLKEINKLGPSSIKDGVDNAIKEFDNILPKSILDKLKYSIEH